MALKDGFIYKEEEYTLVLSESKQILKPAIYGIKPSGSEKKGWDYFCTFYLDGYQLMVKDLFIHSDWGYPVIAGVEPVEFTGTDGFSGMKYEEVSIPVDYQGGIVIGRDFVYDFGLTEEYPCFCYREVMEFLFQNGKAVTTIEHNKAMVRIRKNIKLGLRSLKKGKDARCIRSFLKHSLVGKYRDTFLKKSMKLAKRKMSSIVKRNKEATE